MRCSLSAVEWSFVYCHLSKRRIIMWRSKLLVIFVLSLMIAGCGKEPPQPTSTPRPTATAMPTVTIAPTAIPTATPTAVPQLTATPVATATEEIVLPAGCYSWLIDSEDKFLTFVCGKAKPQLLTFTPGECVFLAADAPEALAIHYVDSEGVIETEIVSPDAAFMCVWTTLTVEVWAETLTQGTERRNALGASGSYHFYR